MTVIEAVEYLLSALFITASLGFDDLLYSLFHSFIRKPTHIKSEPKIFWNRFFPVFDEQYAESPQERENHTVIDATDLRDIAFIKDLAALGDHKFIFIYDESLPDDDEGGLIANIDGFLHTA